MLIDTSNKDLHICYVIKGGDLGRMWYEDGKYLNKKNTITDFIACGKHLISQKYTTSDGLCIEGKQMS